MQPPRPSSINSPENRRAPLDRMVLMVGPVPTGCVGGRLFGSEGGGLICFAMVQLIGFVLFWIGLCGRFDHDIGKAMFLALFATLGLLPVSIFMIFAIPVLSARGFYISIAAH